MLGKKKLEVAYRESVVYYQAQIEEVRLLYKGIIDDQARRIKDLEKLNKSLWDRLMARDLPELATYRPELGPEPAAGKDYNPFMDEENAGEILDEIEPQTNS